MSKTLQQIFSCLLIWAIMVGAASSCFAADRVYLDITAPETRMIQIAVPWFANKNLGGQRQKIGKELASDLGDALKFHGIIDIVAAMKYGDSQEADWRAVGADYAVLGQYSADANSLNLEMRLLDGATNQIVMGKNLSGTVSQKDAMLFKFCDAIIEHLTGKLGVASSRIAFILGQGNTKEVYLTDILGKQYRQITRHKHLTVSPRFVPNSTSLTYSSYHTGNQNLYITDLRQNKVTKVLSRRKGLNLAPAWSSDGSYMILTLSKSGLPDLYMLDRRGEILEQLTDRAGINVSPAFSPDNNYIVFVSDRSGKPQLYLMDMRTRGVRRLTFEGTENAEPAWSPTEDLIVFSSLRDGVYQLYMMNPLREETPRPLTTDMSHHESPCWAPDGNQVLFAKRDGQRTLIYGIMKNGSFQRRILGIPGTQNYPQWAR